MFKYNPTIIINNPGYNNLQKRIVTFAFEKLPRISKKNRSRHISVLTDGKLIIEYGINKEYGIYPNKFSYGSTHSEYDCIRRFLKCGTLEELHTLTLWNVRINRFNEITNSKPCEACFKMLFASAWFPKCVHFSDWNGNFLTIKR